MIAEETEESRTPRPPKLFPLLQYLRDEIGLEYLPPNATLRQKQKDIYNFFQVPLGLEKVRFLSFPSLHCKQQQRHRLLARANSHLS